MNVIYKKTLREQMWDALEGARTDGKKIERFELNSDELYQLTRNPGTACGGDPLGEMVATQKEGAWSFGGVPIVRV